MRLLVLPRYGTKGPNSRYRLWQYIPLFERAGFQVDAKPMLGDDYIEHLYSSGKRPLGSIMRGYLRTLGRIARVSDYDAILLDQELAPYLPALFESVLAKRNSRLIVDYDDAAFWKYRGMPLLAGKIGRVMSAARAVVVGNHHLAEYAERFNQDVRLIPTVVDDAKYPAKQEYRAAMGLRICWIGTPITAAQYLPAVFPVFAELQKRFPTITFRLVGAGQVTGTQGLRVESVQWADQTEGQLISECDIGIMPLPDSEFQRGKCGLKLIQYMASGLPVVASPVGENQYIVDHGKDGFLAGNTEAWIENLDILLRNVDLRMRMGQLGRKKVEERYSLARGFELWMNLLKDVQKTAVRAERRPAMVSRSKKLIV